MKKPVAYKLSREADQDLEEIFDYGEWHFGLDKAVSYLEKFDVLFAELVNYSELGRKHDEIKSGLRGFPLESHIVFYRVLDDHVRILRVLHGSRYLTSFLDEPGF